jgi:hypothetical protein
MLLIIHISIVFLLKTIEIQAGNMIMKPGAWREKLPGWYGIILNRKINGRSQLSKIKSV